MKKVLKIAGLSLLGLLVILTFVFLWQKSRLKEVVYHIETVTKGKIEKRTVATGKVEPRNEILIKPQMSGIISEVYKQAGEIVQTGDIIAKIQVVPRHGDFEQCRVAPVGCRDWLGSKSPQLRTRQQIIRKTK